MQFIELDNECPLEVRLSLTPDDFENILFKRLEANINKNGSRYVADRFNAFSLFITRVYEEIPISTAASDLGMSTKTANRKYHNALYRTFTILKEIEAKAPGGTLYPRHAIIGLLFKFYEKKALEGYSKF